MGRRPLINGAKIGSGTIEEDAELATRASTDCVPAGQENCFESHRPRGPLRALPLPCGPPIVFVLIYYTDFMCLARLSDATIIRLPPPTLLGFLRRRTTFVQASTRTSRHVPSRFP